MSLSPKIDEMRPFVHNSGADIAAFTETCLKDSILDTVVDIPGYDIVRKDRVTRIHGGVCIYIRNQVKFTILHELHNPSFEVLWIKLQHKRLPRGITGIVIGRIYHPPCPDDQSRNDYLINSLTSIEALNINCGIILMDDLNRLRASRINRHFKLVQLDKFAITSPEIVEILRLRS